MTKKQKALIEKAEPYVLNTPLTAIYIIPSGRPYKGPFTGNGFEHMILIGEDAIEERYYYINPEEEVDVLTFFHLSTVHSIDVPCRHGTIRVCFREPVIVDELLSAITPKAIDTKTGRILASGD